MNKKKKEKFVCDECAGENCVLFFTQDIEPLVKFTETDFTCILKEGVLCNWKKVECINPD